MTVNSSKPSTMTKIRALVCPMMINLVIGSFYNFSNINPYVAKYLGVEPDDTIVVMQIWLLMQSLFTIVGVKLSDRIGYWTVNYIAFAGFAVLNLLASFVKDPTVFVLAYGFLAGVFNGLGYLPAMYTAWTYFPESKSVATGTILFCAGISASILSPLSTMIVNPDNLPASDARYGDRVPILFRYLSAIFGVICLIACTFQPAPLESSVYVEAKGLKKIAKDREASKDERNEAKLELKKMQTAHYNDQELVKEHLQIVYRDELNAQVGRFGGEELALINANIEQERVADLIIRQMKFQNIMDDENQKSSVLLDKDQSIKNRLSRVLENNAEALYQKSKQLQEMNCPSVSAAISSVSFMCMVVMAICCSLFPYFLNSNWKVYYQKRLPDITDKNMAFILSFGAIANSFIRLIVGVLLLKIDIKLIYYCIVGISMFIAFTISDLLTTYGIGIMYIMLGYVGLGTQVTLFPTVCTMVFGSTIGPKVYPYIYLCFSISNFAQYFAYKYYGKNGHIETIYYMFGSMAFVGLIVAVLFNPKPSWANAIYKHNMTQLKIDEKKASAKY